MTPVDILGLIFVLLASLLASISYGIFLTRRRIPLNCTTQIEAQVEVEKVQASLVTPAPAPSSCLALPLPATTATRSPSSGFLFDSILGKLARKPANDVVNVSTLPTPVVDMFVTLPPRRRDHEPPVRTKERWFALESDASLETFVQDPLADKRTPVPAMPPNTPCDSNYLSAASTPSLSSRVSSPTSPASTWEPCTPPPPSTPRTAFPVIQVASDVLDPLEESMIVSEAENDGTSDSSAFSLDIKDGAHHVTQKADDNCAVDQRFTSEKGRSSGPCKPVTVGAVSVIPSSPSAYDPFASPYGTTLDMGLKGAKRYDGLIRAISASFSASSLGLPDSRRSSFTKTGSIHADESDSDTSNSGDNDTGDSDASNDASCDELPGCESRTLGFHPGRSQSELSSFCAI
ncbi:hypothetical protein DICSQDRAFT_129788 [Dichomitus squalens LYAD-421 SS1]|uniref:Uncharacterized protein n=1 Tax=Dichomitus squalens (strain LYAD-421) TaxID=732165 RepID=R7SMG1_DICSQ|nr:uncharacterized protein DICSQDRAFT_129788 [Dichomitus squalens LYAD-421 SS1]EJF56930.1 hypothetical protein DICSQDRAFT_129788 [Dichomitus squalens LYAD-421 SS1]